MKRLILTGLVVLLFVLRATPTALSYWQERQLTSDGDRNHQLENISTGRPTAAGSRTTPGLLGRHRNTLTLEKVNIVSQEIVRSKPRQSRSANGFGPGTARLASSRMRHGDAIRASTGVQYGGTARFGRMVSPTTAGGQLGLCDLRRRM